MKNYRNIAVASTFSPRFEAVLAEAKRMAEWFGGSLSIIHAGQQTQEKQDRFLEAIRKLDLPEQTPIFWGDGNAPAEEILQAVTDNEIDLMIAGALRQTEGDDSRNFTGNLSRDLMRLAPCDLIFLTSPQAEPLPIESIVVEVEMGADDCLAVRCALELGKRGGASRLMPVTVLTPFAQRKFADSAEIENWLCRLATDAGPFDGQLDCRVIQSNTGFKVCEFVEANQANLLVLRADIRDGQRQVSAHMDWIYQVIPTNLWIVH